MYCPDQSSYELALSASLLDGNRNEERCLKPAGAKREARQSFAESRSEEHTSELQSLRHLVCRLLLEAAAHDIYTLSLHDALPISLLDGNRNEERCLKPAGAKREARQSFAES